MEKQEKAKIKNNEKIAGYLTIKIPYKRNGKDVIFPKRIKLVFQEARG